MGDGRIEEDEEEEKKERVGALREVSISEYLDRKATHSFLDTATCPFVRLAIHCRSRLLYVSSVLSAKRLINGRSIAGKGEPNSTRTVGKDCIQR